jgi:hypothetical protein
LLINLEQGQDLKMSKFKFQIDKFNGDNFIAWRDRLEAILEAEEVLFVITTARPLTEDQTEKQAKWDKANAMAKAWLKSAITDDVLHLIRDKQTTKEILDTLRDRYQRKSDANIHHLKAQLYNYRMSDEKTITENLVFITNILAQLSTIDATMPATDQVSIMLNSLPPSFKEWKDIHNHIDSKETPESLISKLLDEERRRKGSTSTRDDEAYNIRGKKKYCPIHQSNTHALDECYSNTKSRNYLKARNTRKWKESNKDRNKDNNKGKQTDNNDEHVNLIQDPYVWILDSGATSHICCKAEAFTKLNKKNSYVYLANDSKVKVSGIGTVPLRMALPDNSSIILELKNVLLIPSFNKNFLSTHKLNDSGYTITLFSEGAKIIKDNETVGLARKVGNLRILNGMFAKDVDEVNMLVDLWHRRLGHLGLSRLRTAAKIMDNIRIPKGYKEFSFCRGCAEGKSSLCNSYINSFFLRRIIYCHFDSLCI